EGGVVNPARNEFVCVGYYRKRHIGISGLKTIDALLSAVTEAEERDHIAADDRVGRDDWIRRHEIREVTGAAGDGRVQVGHHAERISVLSIHANLARIAITEECDITPADDWSSVPVGIARIAGC